eukprot:702088-Prymnesium_polylepis.1
MVRGMAHQAVGGNETACTDEVTCADAVKETASGMLGSETMGEPWMRINPLLARSEATAYAVARSTKSLPFSVTVAPPEVHGGEFRARAFTTPVQRHTLTSPAAMQTEQEVWIVFAGEGGLWPGMGAE